MVAARRLTGGRCDDLADHVLISLECSRLRRVDFEIHDEHDVFSLTSLGVNIPRVNIEDDPQLGELFWAQFGVQGTMASDGELAWA
jgi:hypothetical protein